MISSALVEGAREGEVEEEARDMEELLVRWIWELSRGVHESGRRTRATSNAIHGEPREERTRKTSRRGE